MLWGLSMRNMVLWAFAWFWRIITLGKGWRLIALEGHPYLLRLYLFPGVYLHHFFMSDLDRELHNHPWIVAHTRILSGWYLEQSLTSDGTVKERVFSQGDTNSIYAEDFHRIAAISEGCWTLFRPQDRIQKWGFLDVETGHFRLAEDQID